MANIFQNQAQRYGVTLRVVSEDNLPLLSLDEDRSAQIFSNLVSNSLRHTKKGGEVILSAAREGGNVVLCVQDNGCGIPQNALPNVFNRFYRADSSRHDENSSGLGLAIAKALVEGQGGTIQAESQDGKGTCMRMTFPIGEAQQATVERCDHDPAATGKIEINC